ncbi:MAG: hypothetical protein IT271_09975 [Chitinophagales bacterium]|nr:hypothetical protein [Chitinophagales bacterium]
MKNLFSLLLLVFTLQVYGQSNIYGTWNNEEVGTLIFNSNGSGTFAGGSFTYTSTASKIFAYSEDGNFTYSYKVVNGQLIISGGIFPAPVTFTKSKNTSSGTSGNTKSGSIDKSIVGTWCWTKTSGTYTNASSGSTRCIVINADGTYQYTYEGSISGSGGGYYGGSASQSADHGTWKLNGNTISVVSASEGALTYSFQKKNHPKTGDPMIVIDGDAYVTYYQKNPW